MKRASVFLSALLLLVLVHPFVSKSSSAAITNNSGAVEDVYKVEMRLKVPAIVNNMESQGKRVYKTQKVVGEMHVSYADGRADIRFENLVNKSYKIGGQYVTYDTTVSSAPIWVAIGDNKRGVFKTATLCVGIDADPSYNIGSDEPDNALILTLSGSGKQFGRIRGNASGQLGCGCHAYGHVSPTRTLGPDGATAVVQDIAACYGTFTAKWVRRISAVTSNADKRNSERKPTSFRGGIASTILT